MHLDVMVRPWIPPPAWECDIQRGKPRLQHTFMRNMRMKVRMHACLGCSFPVWQAQTPPGYPPQQAHRADGETAHTAGGLPLLWLRHSSCLAT